MKEPVINDELPGRIITGKVLIRPSIKEVKKNSVIFNYTPKEQPIDIIVFATGYTFAFPFLDETVVKVEDGQASLYKYIFPAHLEKPTLAVIGLIKPLGSMIPTGETQARWAVQVLKGVNKLPPRSVMIEEVNARKENRPSGLVLRGVAGGFGLDEFPPKCRRSQARVQKQRMGKSMRHSVYLILTRVNH